MGINTNRPFVSFEKVEDIGPFSSISTYNIKNKRNEKTQFLLSPFSYNPIYGVKKPVVLSEINSSGDYLEFRGQLLNWTDAENKNHSYRLVNFGFSQLRRSWPALEHLVAEGLKMYPNEPMVVTIPQNTIAHRDRLLAWQKWASQKVTHAYAKRKEYLDRDELFALRDFDVSMHRNDDYFVLLKDSGLSSFDLTSERFDQDALAIIRLARLNQHSGLIPRSWWKATDEQLPVTARFKGSSVGDLLYQSINRVDKYAGKRIAEISRFVRFQDFPEPIMDAFLKNLFDVTVNKKDPVVDADAIDAFVISVDRKTRRLFRSKYRFQDLARLNPSDSESPEFLMVLLTESPEFRQTYADLQKTTQGVQVIPVAKSTNSNKADILWNTPDLWYEGSSTEKSFWAEKEVNKARATVLSRASTNLSKANMGRAKQIAQWIASEKTIPRHLLHQINRLSFADRIELFNKSVLFSTLFKELIKRISESFPTDGRLLIITNEGLEPFKELIAPQFEGRNVVVVKPSDLKILSPQNADTVILFGIDDSSVDEQAKFHLRSKGSLLLYKHFTDNLKSSLPQTLIRYAEDIIKNGAPLTEVELAIELAQRRLFYESKSEKPSTGWYNPNANDAQIYYGISTRWVKP